MKKHLFILFNLLLIFGCNTNLLDIADDGEAREGYVQIWDTEHEIATTDQLWAMQWDVDAGYNTIPPEIGQLVNLEVLIITNKGFTGEIPPEIGNLKKLHTMRLYGNEFNGELPSELFTLDSLYNLELNDNQFTGEIPSSIGDLTKLRFVRLQDNQFSGTIPESICNLDSYSAWGDTTEFDSYYISFGNNNFCPDPETGEYPACFTSSTLGTQTTDNCP